MSLFYFPIVRRQVSPIVCILLAGCSLDTDLPEGARAQTMPGSTWQPPSAAERSETRGALTSVVDAAAPNVSPDSGRAGAVTMAHADGGMSPPPVAAASDAGATTLDAAQASRGDAAGPRLHDAATVPTAADAAMPPSAADAAAPVVAAECRPGRYVGTFSGSIRVGSARFSNVVGTIRAELTRDAAAGLMIGTARVNGTDRNENILSVSLSGRVDCATLQLENGLLQDGSFYYAQARARFPFHGSLEGDYSKAPPTITGTWSGESNDLASASGEGRWNLRFSE